MYVLLQLASYPLDFLMQIFDNTKSLTGNNHWTIHFAKISFNENNFYEYKFILLNSHEVQIKNIFDSGYIIKIFIEYLHFNLDAI